MAQTPTKEQAISAIGTCRPKSTSTPIAASASMPISNGLIVFALPPSNDARKEL